MPTLVELRLRTGLSASGLARKANIDRNTLNKAERGLPITQVKAYAVVSALSQILNEEIRMTDVDNLNIIP